MAATYRTNKVDRDGSTRRNHADHAGHDHAHRRPYRRAARSPRLGERTDRILEENMGDQIELSLTLERVDAATLLECLERQLEALQRIEQDAGAELLAAAQREKAAVIPVIMALESALRTSRPH
jgi:hypothetical protein